MLFKLLATQAALLFFFSVVAQSGKVVVSGTLRSKQDKSLVGYAGVVLKRSSDSTFVAGVVANEKGEFSITNVNEGSYFLEVERVGFYPVRLPFLAGKLNVFFDLGVIELIPMPVTLNEVMVVGKAGTVDSKMEKKTFRMADNISQAGGSLLQSMKNLPGITIDESGKLMLRGSSRVTVLLDGKQTALTGSGSQAALDNIPASAIDRIEIINNPSARFETNGNAGIINIIYKKSMQEGLNGKIGLASGLGALWSKRQSFSGSRPQYRLTPKVNPSLGLNYRSTNVNIFFQGDYYYNKTLNRNDFAERYYDNGDTIRQQVQRNRITTTSSFRTGADWNINNRNSLTVSGLFSREKILDHGDIPYYNGSLTERRRLWQFLEDEVNTATTLSAVFQHSFSQPGHQLSISLNHTFHREDEKYFLTDIKATYTGKDTFMLIADEKITDLSVDYSRPLKRGRFETGVKVRARDIPADMRFYPGLNSSLDTNAAGWARYREFIPALYSNYVYESNRVEVEAGIRLEYVKLRYLVNPDHNTYTSDGYNYFKPFPGARLSYNLNKRSRLSFFYNRRVDRPDEGDIRIFPKYDEPEVLKVGNPGLRPQFTHSFEAGYRNTWASGFLYLAAFHKRTRNLITRIGTVAPGSGIIYSVFQNADRSGNSGLEWIYGQQLGGSVNLNLNAMVYKSKIQGFSTVNMYPVPVSYHAETVSMWSGNIKANARLKLRKNSEFQLMAIYLAPEIIPQGRLSGRFSMDAGISKTLLKNKGEVFLNATDILNTFRLKKSVTGDGFRLISTDYYETQVFRIGFNYKF